jgi:hypothetical protein
MSKTYMRKSKTNKSSLRKIELIVRRGFFRKAAGGPALAPGFRGWPRLKESETA